MLRGVAGGDEGRQAVVLGAGLGAPGDPARAVDGGDLSYPGGDCWPVPIVPVMGHPVVSSRGSGSLLPNSSGSGCAPRIPQEASRVRSASWPGCQRDPVTHRQGQLACPCSQALSGVRHRACRVSLLRARMSFRCVKPDFPDHSSVPLGKHSSCPINVLSLSTVVVCWAAQSEWGIGCSACYHPPESKRGGEGPRR